MREQKLFLTVVQSEGRRPKLNRVFESAVHEFGVWQPHFGPNEW